VPRNALLPKDEEDLPPTDYPAGVTLQWLSADDPVGYRQRGGHPVYGEHDVVYRMNRLGYRGPEFDAAAQVRIITVGCSYVMGIGVAEADLFHERFAARLRAESSKSTVVWNLGRAGVSNDYICRLLHLAVPRLDPHMVLINFTHAARREYLSVQNQPKHYNPAFAPADAVTREIFGHFAALSSPYDDQLNFYKNYKAIELILAGRCWLYSHIKPHELEPLAAHVDARRYAGPLRFVDRARDGGHAGPESHRILADLYWERFVAIGGPETLAQILT